MKRALLPALLLAAATAASAQTVYRCGPDGSDYRQTPCPGGHPVNVADPRTDAQRQEAAQRAQRDTALLQELRRDQPAAALLAHAPATAHAKPVPIAPAERKTAPKRHGKTHLPADGSRIARGPKPEKAEAPRPAKPQQADKAQP